MVRAPGLLVQLNLYLADIARDPNTKLPGKKAKRNNASQIAAMVDVGLFFVACCFVQWFSVRLLIIITIFCATLANQAERLSNMLRNMPKKLAIVCAMILT